MGNIVVRANQFDSCLPVFLPCMCFEFMNDSSAKRGVFFLYFPLKKIDWGYHPFFGRYFGFIYGFMPGLWLLSFVFLAFSSKWAQ